MDSSKKLRVRKSRSVHLALEITACFEVGLEGNKGVCGALWPHVLWGHGVGGVALESCGPRGPRSSSLRCAVALDDRLAMNY